MDICPERRSASGWWRLRAAAAACLALWSVCPAALAAAPTVQTVEVQAPTASAAARVALSLSAAVDHKAFTLDAPPRLVVDLAAAEAGAGLVLPAPAAGSPVNGVRLAKRGNGLRLVVDLAAATPYRTRLVAAAKGRPARLEIELGAPLVVAATALKPPVTPPVQAPVTAPVSAQVAAPVLTAAAAPTPSPALSSASSVAVSRTNSSPAAPAGASAVASAAEPAKILAQGAMSPRAAESARVELPRTELPRAEPVRSEPPRAESPRSEPSRTEPVRDASSRTREPRVGRDLVIAVDAGHGGKDPGAHGLNGTLEKDVTLAVARRLAAALQREPGMRAYLVRDDDYFVELRQRMARARKAGADLFVSIHADAAHNRAAAGSSVYILSTRGASSEAARWLADRENAADLAGGVQLDKVDPTVASVLMDLSQGDTITSSDRAARLVLNELDRIGNVHKREVQSAGFMVLKSPDIPSMLVETAFISHPGEEARLADPEHQQRLAEAIQNGVRAYFYSNPPPGTRVAQLAAARRDASRVMAAGP